MLVVTDLEWVEESEGTEYLTQLAAVRVDENWEVLDSFSTLASLPLYDNSDWTHVAFNGYSPEDFMGAVHEKQALQSFQEWLQEGDVLCLWPHEAKKRLRTLWRKHSNEAFGHKMKCCQNKVRECLQESGEVTYGLYDLARKQGINTPSPEHRSTNDVQVLRELLLHTFSDREDFRKKTPKEMSLPEETQTKAERNRRFMEDTSDYFVFTKDSDVFHRRGCSRMLRANTILGALYYDVAAENRRPCRVCNPMSKHGLRDGDVKRHVTLFDGTTGWMKSKNVVGYCHSKLHPGMISRGLLDAHDCLGKQCRHLQKFPDCVYWHNLEEEKKATQKAKEQKKAAIARARAEEQRLLDLRDEFQSFLDYTEEYMEVIRVEQEKAAVYKIYYVSDNPFADGNRFQDFLECIRHYHPNWRIVLRHIKDMDGRFVTIDEFYARKRA